MNQYLLFDLDGTLTDPKIGITTCVQYALKSFGIEEPDLDKLEPFIGPPLKDSFMEFYQLDETQAEEAIAKYRERFQSVGMFENKVYPGIKKLLRRCKRKGAVLAVASSKPEIFVKKILEHFHLAQYFDVIVGSELDGRKTAKEEVVYEALHQLFPKGDIDYDNTVMIGDRKFDIQGAKDNKVVSVGVSYGYGSFEELREAHADYIVRTVEELEEVLLRGRDKGREKAVVFWQKPGAARKAAVVLFPLLCYIMASDVLRMLAILLTGKFAAVLPETFFVYDEAGRLMAMAGSVAAAVNGLVFLTAFAILYVFVGRTDLIQEKFCFRLRNTTEGWNPKDKTTLQKLAEALGVTGLAVGMSVGFQLLFSLTGLMQSSGDFAQVSERQMTTGLLMGLLLYGVLSPLAEELIFRGIVFSRMKRYLPVTVSAIFSAALFGIYHGNIVQALYGFLAGCVFALVYHKSGSFVLTAALHGLMNVTGFLWAFYHLSATPFYHAWTCILAFGIAALSLLLLKKAGHWNFRRKNKT